MPLDGMREVREVGGGGAIDDGTGVGEPSGWLYRQRDGNRDRVYRGLVVAVNGPGGRELRARQADAIAALLAWASTRHSGRTGEQLDEQDSGQDAEQDKRPGNDA